MVLTFYYEKLINMCLFLFFFLLKKNIQIEEVVQTLTEEGRGGSPIKKMESTIKGRKTQSKTHQEPRTT